jgi:hypothetical protein
MKIKPIIKQPFVKTAVLLVVTFAVSSGALFAQNWKLTLDENGHGTANGNPLPFTVGPDPTGGITTSPVLIYTLPFDVQPGEVTLLESGQPNAPISDVIRFFEPLPGANFSDLIFYSDIEAGERRDLADVGLPASGSNFIPEVGPEGNNGAVWNAAFPSPGTPLLGGPVSGTADYTIISDVPEPGSAALLLAGAAILGKVGAFRRKRAALNGGRKS